MERRVGMGRSLWAQNSVGDGNQLITFTAEETVAMLTKYMMSG